MSTISENRPHLGSTTRPSTSNPPTSSPSFSSSVSRPTSPTGVPAIRDSVRFSSELVEAGSGNSSSLALLQGLQDNYGKNPTNPTNTNSATEPTDPGEPAGDGRDTSSSDQKIEKLQSTLEQLKGLKGEELKKKLAELGQSDPELARLLEKMLEDENGEKKSEGAKEAKKSASADDGAPSETFLWKPVSDSDGKLAILLPSSLDAQSVTVSGPNFNESINKGGRNGSRGNGQREHYRFSKPGNAMRGPVQVHIALTTGGSKTITIKNPAERNEGGKLQDAGQSGF